MNMFEIYKLNLLNKQLNKNEPTDANIIIKEILSVINLVIKIDAIEDIDIENRWNKKAGINESSLTSPLTMEKAEAFNKRRYLRGRCGDFALMLETIFPMTECYSIHNGSHFFVKYNNLLFDAAGLHTVDEALETYSEKHPNAVDISIEKHRPSELEHGCLCAGWVTDQMYKKYIIPAKRHLITIRNNNTLQTTDTEKSL